MPWIKAIDCGLGLQDLLVILFFSIDPNFEIILIEEPESHVHPDMQRKLLYYIKHKTEKQFFLTTHSNVFLDNSLVDKIYYVYFTDSVFIDDATSRAAILDDLGYSVTDNIVSDLVVFVEGPTDVPVLEEFLIKMGLYGKYSIKIWPLGGDIMSQLDLSVFSQNYKIVALVDNDPQSGKIRSKFIKNCKDNNIQVHRLKAYSIENYLSLRALREVFGKQIDSSLEEIDPKTRIDKQIGLNPKKQNRRIAQLMTIDEIEGTDLHKFLKSVEQILVHGEGT